MTQKLKKVSMEILELGLKTGEARASPASLLPMALAVTLTGDRTMLNCTVHA